MAYSKPFLRLVALGTTYQTETFAFGVSLIEATLPTPEAPTEVSDEVVAAVSAFFQTTGMISASCHLTALKLNLIGTDGKYVNDETVVRELDPPVAGSGSNNPPPQNALAITLDTGLRRGRAHAGRFYVPCFSSGLTSSGVLGSAVAGIYATNAGIMLDNLNDALAPWQVGVVSDLGSGAQHRVTAVRVGQVIDTIRSRRTSLPEGYVSVDLSTAP